MNKVLGFMLNKSEIELLNRYRDEFCYQVVCIDNIDKINETNFFIGFFNLEEASDNTIEAIKYFAASNKDKRLIIINSIDSLNSEKNISKIPNILNNPGNTRLEILRSYQKYTFNEIKSTPYSYKLKRLFQITMLFEKRKVITMDELVKIFKMDKRTIARDLRLLKDSGVIIKYDKNYKAYVLIENYLS